MVPTDPFAELCRIVNTAEGVFLLDFAIPHNNCDEENLKLAIRKDKLNSFAQTILLANPAPRTLRFSIEETHRPVVYGCRVYSLSFGYRGEPNQGLLNALIYNLSLGFADSFAAANQQIGLEI